MNSTNTLFYACMLFLFVVTVYAVDKASPVPNDAIESTGATLPDVCVCSTTDEKAMAYGLTAEYVKDMNLSSISHSFLPINGACPIRETIANYSFNCTSYADVSKPRIKPTEYPTWKPEIPPEVNAP